MAYREGEMRGSTPSARWIGQWLVGLMSIGPFAIGFDLAFHIFSSTPVIQRMRGEPPIAHVGWVACGFLGIATIICLKRRPFVGFFLSLAMAILYVISGLALWHQLTFYSFLAGTLPFIAGYVAFGPPEEGAEGS